MKYKSQSFSALICSIEWNSRHVSTMEVANSRKTLILTIIVSDESHSRKLKNECEEKEDASTFIGPPFICDPRSISRILESMPILLLAFPKVGISYYLYWWNINQNTCMALMAFTAFEILVKHGPPTLLRPRIRIFRIHNSWANRLNKHFTVF